MTNFNLPPQPRNRQALSHGSFSSRSRLATIGLLSLAVGLGGCATRVNQFKTFSDAGVAYAGTMDKLLAESGGVSIDADSSTLLQAKDIMPPGSGDVLGERLEKHDEQMAERLKILADIREHTNLLKAYFEALAALAGSDAPTQSGEAAKGLVAELEKLDLKIAKAQLGGGTIGSLIGPVTELVVASFQQAALERELKKNAKTIERELALQVAAIEAVAGIWKADQQIILGRSRTVSHEQFKADAAVPGAWSANRKAILVTSDATDLVDGATDAAKKLKKSFENLVQKKLNVEDVPMLANDLGKVLALLELVRVQPAAETATASAG